MKSDLKDVSMLRRAAAEIEIAMAAATEGAATPDQLADLADAIDAFKDGAYGVAASLARGSMAARRKVEYSRRPASMSRSLIELRETFARFKREHRV